MIDIGHNTDGDIIGRQIETLAQEIEAGKTYIVKACCHLKPEHIKELEKNLSEKTKANIVILDGLFESVEYDDTPPSKIINENMA